MAKVDRAVPTWAYCPGPPLDYRSRVCGGPLIPLSWGDGPYALITACIRCGSMVRVLKLELEGVYPPDWERG